MRSGRALPRPNGPPTALRSEAARLLAPLPHVWSPALTAQHSEARGGQVHERYLRRRLMSIDRSNFELFGALGVKQATGFRITAMGGVVKTEPPNKPCKHDDIAIGDTLFGQGYSRQ